MPPSSGRRSIKGFRLVATAVLREEILAEHSNHFLLEVMILERRTANMSLRIGMQSRVLQ